MTQRENIVNNIVDILWENGLTVQDVDISEYENAIIKAIRGATK